VTQVSDDALHMHDRGRSETGLNVQLSTSTFVGYQCLHPSLYQRKKPCWTYVAFNALHICCSPLSSLSAFTVTPPTS
jgi:hypothetical protein